MDKSFFRKKIIYLRDSLEINEKKIKDDKIKENFKCTLLYKNSKNIFIYLGFGSEIDTKLYVKEFLDEGKNIFCPKINYKNKTMEAVKITSLSNLVSNHYGILEPLCEFNEDIYNNDDIDLIIVPGISFDLSGGRIGYGGGYYDKLLKYRYTNVPKVALAYEFQVIDDVPMEHHDIRVDYIITEERKINILKNTKIRI